MESERQGSKRLGVGWPVVRVQAVLVRTTLMRKAKSIGRLANNQVCASSRLPDQANLPCTSTCRLSTVIIILLSDAWTIL